MGGGGGPSLYWGKEGGKNTREKITRKRFHLSHGISKKTKNQKEDDQKGRSA